MSIQTKTMPRHIEVENRPSRRPSDDIDDNDSSDYSTDSDCEYHLSPEDTSSLTHRSGVSERVVNETFCKQRGVCRITGWPFGNGIYRPVLVARKCTEPLSDGNCMLVIELIDRLRNASQMNWRTFVRFLQLAALNKIEANTWEEGSREWRGV